MGGIELGHFEFGSHLLPFTRSEWHWISADAGHGLRWLPWFDRSEAKTSVFLPLWPFPLLWLILWPLWMAKADKKEEERFRGSMDLKIE